MNNCPTCYEHTIASCTKLIQLNIKLNPLTGYTITVTDKFGNVFVTSAQTDAAGTLTIDTDNFPPYLFNSYGGTFQLQFYASTNCNPAQFKACNEVYTCIIIKVAQVFNKDDNNPTAQIPCCTDGIGTPNPDPGQEPDPKPPGGGGLEGGNTSGGSSTGGYTTTGSSTRYTSTGGFN